MDIIVIFFRDILDGPLYFIVSLLSLILICSCIGYMAEQSELKKATVENLNNKYKDIEKNSRTIENEATDMSTSLSNDSPKKF